jgi:predicted DNA-binding protein
MSDSPSEKQIAIKLNEQYISRLDNLAKRGRTNRRQLMVNFIKLWLDELERSNTAVLFHSAIIHRGIEVEMRLDSRRKREFLESYIPEKPFPIILSEDDNLRVGIAASKASMSRHHMIKNMSVIGIE